MFGLALCLLFRPVFDSRLANSQPLVVRSTGGTHVPIYGVVVVAFLIGLMGFVRTRKLGFETLVSVCQGGSIEMQRF
jgi:hypothetical protein